MPGSFKFKLRAKTRVSGGGGSTGSGGSTSMNAYYEDLSTRGTFFTGNTMRTSSGIAALGGAVPNYTYASTADAMLITWPQDEISVLGAQPKMQIQESGTDEYLVIWHAKYGSMWRPATDGGGLHAQMGPGYTHKEWQLRFGPISTGGASDAISWETRNRLYSSGIDYSNAFAKYDNRSYNIQDEIANGPYSPIGYGEGGAAPVHPTGRGAEPAQTIDVRINEWTRYVTRIKANVESTAFPEWESDLAVTLSSSIQYHQISQWIQTPRGISRVAYKIPVLDTTINGANDRSKIVYFYAEQNTSEHQPHASGNVTFSGTPFTVLNSNQKVEQVATASRYTIAAVSSAVRTIGAGGTVSLSVTGDDNNESVAAKAGPNENCSSGSALTVINPPAGCDSTSSVGAGGLTGGDWFCNTDGIIHSRDWIVMKNYASAAFSSTTPEDDSVIFASMAAWV